MPFSQAPLMERSMRGLCCGGSEIISSRRFTVEVRASWSASHIKKLSVFVLMGLLCHHVLLYFSTSTLHVVDITTGE